MLHYIYCIALALLFSTISLQAEVQTQSPAQLSIKVAHDSKLGDILTDSKGRTVYLFTLDSPDVSNCDEGCSKVWPAVLVSSDKLPASNLPGTLDVIKRGDKEFQLTYNKMPLYYYVKDTKPGDTKGQNVDEQWFVVHPKNQFKAKP